MPSGFCACVHNGLELRVELIGRIIGGSVDRRPGYCKSYERFVRMISIRQAVMGITESEG